jgi:hypothetical protein
MLGVGLGLDKMIATIVGVAGRILTRLASLLTLVVQRIVKVELLVVWMMVLSLLLELCYLRRLLMTDNVLLEIQQVSSM